MTASQQFTAYAKTQNEGRGGFNPYEDAMQAEAGALAEARMQHVIGNLDAYKAAWNAAVAKYVKGEQVRREDISKIEAEAGITLSEIKSAKARVA